MAGSILIIKHIPIEGPGSIGRFLKDTAWNMQIIDLSLRQHLPDDTAGIEAVIILGGPMNVYETEKYPFLKKEADFLRKALKGEVPVLGICLGAQLLAKACGAKIVKAGQKEMGWHEVYLTEAGRADPLFEGLSLRLNIFQWHEDTFDIPDGGKLLAESPSCRNQAFRYGRSAYGLQFHVEVTVDMVESWIKEYTGSNALAGSATDNMIIEAYKSRESIEKQASVIYLNFARIIESSRKADSSALG